MGKHAYPFLPIKLLLREIIDNVKEVSSFNSPLLLLHGDQDNIVPYSMSEHLLQVSNSDRKTLITLNR